MLTFRLAETQSKMLKDKLKSLIPDQEKGNKKIIEMRKIIFDSVWAQSEYTNYEYKQTLQQLSHLIKMSHVEQGNTLIEIL